MCGLLPCLPSLATRHTGCIRTLRPANSSVGRACCGIVAEGHPGPYHVLQHGLNENLILVRSLTIGLHHPLDCLGKLWRRNVGDRKKGSCLRSRYSIFTSTARTDDPGAGTDFFEDLLLTLFGIFAPLLNRKEGKRQDSPSLEYFLQRLQGLRFGGKLKRHYSITLTA